MLSSSKRHLLRHFPIHKADGIEETGKKEEEKREEKKGIVVKKRENILI